MKYNFVRIGMLILILAGFQQLMAQYPSIPSDVQKWSDSLLDAAKKHSDEAWAKALPAIDAEAKNGKPYIPWASRPDELPQAEVPAFPGAEGGGKSK